jgi:hypothetical protein
VILEDVRVLHRTGQWCSGVRTADNVVAYDVPILPQWQAPGRPTVDRCFVLLDEGVQVMKPNTFTGVLEGGWYIDLISVEESEPKRLIIHDLKVDHLLLRNLDQDVLESWPDFPPATVRELAELPPFEHVER